jgi:hypothetical protein
MGNETRQFEIDRAARNRRRRRYEMRREQLRRDLAPESLVARLERHGRAVVDGSAEIARHNSTAIAGGAAALGLWLLRKPILAWFGGKFGGGEEEKEMEDDYDRISDNP